MPIDSPGGRLHPAKQRPCSASIERFNGQADVGPGQGTHEALRVFHITRISVGSPVTAKCTCGSRTGRGRADSFAGNSIAQAPAPGVYAILATLNKPAARRTCAGLREETSRTTEELPWCCQAVGCQGTERGWQRESKTIDSCR